MKFIFKVYDLPATPLSLSKVLSMLVDVAEENAFPLLWDFPFDQEWLYPAENSIPLETDAGDDAPPTVTP